MRTNTIGAAAAALPLALVCAAPHVIDPGAPHAPGHSPIGIVADQPYGAAASPGARRTR